MRVDQCPSGIAAAAGFESSASTRRRSKGSVTHGHVDHRRIVLLRTCGSGPFRGGLGLMENRPHAVAAGVIKPAADTTGRFGRRDDTLGDLRSSGRVGHTPDRGASSFGEPRRMSPRCSGRVAHAADSATRRMFGEVSAAFQRGHSSREGRWRLNPHAHGSDSGCWISGRAKPF